MEAIKFTPSASAGGDHMGPGRRIIDIVVAAYSLYRKFKVKPEAEVEGKELIGYVNKKNNSLSLAIFGLFLPPDRLLFREVWKVFLTW